MEIWATFLPTYDFPHLSLTRAEAREYRHKHIFKGKVVKAWVEWPIEMERFQMGSRFKGEK